MTLLVLDVECPRCGTKPNLRVLPSLLELIQDAEPDHQLGTWECQGCRKVTTPVVITAGMIQRATLPALTQPESGT